MFNQLLTEQLQSHLGNTTALPDAFAAFIKSVNASYDCFGKQIKSLEDAVGNSIVELGKLNEKLLSEAASIQNAHNELSRIFNKADLGFFVKDIIENKYIRISVGCEKIYGYSIGDFNANNLLWFQVIHPDDQPTVEKDNELLNNGVQIKRAYRIIHRDKTTRWIEVKAIPVIIDGRLARVEGVVNDVTESKKRGKVIDR